jgi:hypothetical protein
VTATGQREPKSRVCNVSNAALMLAYLSCEAGRGRTEPRGVRVSLQRRTHLLARAREMAAEIKARP